MTKKSWQWIDRALRAASGMAGAMLALTLGAQAGALSLSLAPSALAPAVGSSFTVDLVVSGSVAGAAPSLGAFDVTVLFDPSALSFTGVTYGALLGAVPAEATTGTVTGTGSVALAEVSFLSPGALDALQPDGFALATLGFTATREALTTISIGSALLSDAFGSEIRAETPYGAATVRASAAVPEPGGALLYAVGLLVASRSWALRRRAQ